MPRPGVAWAVPGLVFFSAFALVPMVAVAYLSMTKWRGVGDIDWVGFQNWANLPDDRFFRNSIWIMLLLLVGTIVIQLPIGIVLGTWAAGREKNRAVLSAIYFLPLVSSTAATATVWKQLMDPNFGIPSQLKAVFGGTGDFIGTRPGAITMLLVVGAWHYVPFHTLIFQGAVRSIPEVLYQAAEVDGAGRFRQFFHVTLPQLKQTIITSLIFMVVGGLTAFDTVLILTNGGPGRDTMITPLLMYFTAFREYKFGLAAVMAVILIAVAAAISIVLTRLSRYDRMDSAREGI
jgi:xylobiose transport system permease protein